MPVKPSPRDSTDPINDHGKPLANSGLSPTHQFANRFLILRFHHRRTALATIFIVDDNPMISRPLGLLMNLVGHQTACFTDPAELLPALRARRAAVVLL